MTYYLVQTDACPAALCEVDEGDPLFHGKTGRLDVVHILPYGDRAPFEGHIARYENELPSRWRLWRLNAHPPDHNGVFVAAGLSLDRGDFSPRVYCELLHPEHILRNTFTRTVPGPPQLHFQKRRAIVNINLSAAPAHLPLPIERGHLPVPVTRSLVSVLGGNVSRLLHLPLQFLEPYESTDRFIISREQMLLDHIRL